MRCVLKALLDARPCRLFVGKDALKRGDEHRPVYLVKKQKVVAIMMKYRIKQECFILLARWLSYFELKELDIQYLTYK